MIGHELFAISYSLLVSSSLAALCRPSEGVVN